MVWNDFCMIHLNYSISLCHFFSFMKTSAISMCLLSQQNADGYKEVPLRCSINLKIIDFVFWVLSKSINLLADRGRERSLNKIDPG